MNIEITDSESLYFGRVFKIIDELEGLVSVDTGGGAFTWFHKSEFKIIE